MRPFDPTLALALVVLGCSDPVHDDAVAALGGEKGGVRPGPTHRPGEPCLTCHGGEGPANFVMAIGGTVFSHLTSTVAASGARVRLVDANQRTFETFTNCAGNFWVPVGTFPATYPVQAAVTLENVSEVMRTKMHDGSCNGCHVRPALGAGAQSGQNAGTPGQIWVLPDTTPAAAERCP